jgi:hypothetical protein
MSPAFCLSAHRASALRFVMHRFDRIQAEAFVPFDAAKRDMLKPNHLERRAPQWQSTHRALDP